MKSKLIFQLLLFSGIILATVYSCEYHEVLPYEPDPNVDILFSQDIIPIFDASCNAAGCHNGSGSSPDLRSSVAYDALWTGGYINVDVPEQSELYLWMTDSKGPMPPLGGNETNNAKVLQWIEQGAQNN